MVRLQEHITSTNILRTYYEHIEEWPVDVSIQTSSTGSCWIQAIAEAKPGAAFREVAVVPLDPEDIAEYPNSWIIDFIDPRKMLLKWIIWGYPYFRTPLITI